MTEIEKFAFNNNVIKTKRELLFKCLVIGDFGVGKTSLIRRYAEGTFSSVYKITIGADFAVKTLDWKEMLNVNLQLWDIAGHERFGYLTSVYYRYAVGAIIVFDLTRPDTFKSVEKWLLDVRSKVKLPNGQPIPIIILANKGDLQLSIPAQITEFCKKYEIASWFITSAKQNTNIDEAINCLLEIIVNNHENMENTFHNSITLSQTTEISEKAKNCCN